MKLAVRDRIEPEILDTEAEEADDLADDPERLPRGLSLAARHVPFAGAVELIDARKTSAGR